MLTTRNRIFNNKISEFHGKASELHNNIADVHNNISDLNNNIFFDLIWVIAGRKFYMNIFEPTFYHVKVDHFVRAT